MDPSFESRKKSHFDLALKKDSQSLFPTGFDSVQLIHSALPELDLKDVSTQYQWEGKNKGQSKNKGPSLKTPFFASSMTGGWSDSLDFNLKLAKACETHSWMMGVGSQRGQLNDPSKAKEWRALRKACPKLVLFGNLGLSQLLEISLKQLLSLVDSLEAQAMIIHLNPLQEALQKEGRANFKGGLKALKKLVQASPVPIIVKETGCGFSKENLDSLNDMGLWAVDLSGRGGTHWGRIEGHRYSKSSPLFGIGENFSSWGHSTLSSLLYSQEKKRDYQVWASGGLRSGVDACKALALGAKAVGFAHILLKALQQSEEALDSLMFRLEKELKVSLFCTGSASIQELQRTKKWHIPF